MKRDLLWFSRKRGNRWIDGIDRAVGIALVAAFCFQLPLGLTDFLQRQFGLSKNWAKCVLLICVIVLFMLEQLITYYIDRRISNREMDRKSEAS